MQLLFLISVLGSLLPYNLAGIYTQFPFTYNVIPQYIPPAQLVATYSLPQPAYQTHQTLTTYSAPTSTADAYVNPFRGFTYQTRYDDGSTSRVLFVTGPEANSIRTLISSNLQYTPPVQSNITNTTENESARNAKTLASDMLDPIKSESQKNETLPSESVATFPANSFQTFYAGQHIINPPSLIDFRTAFAYSANAIPISTGPVYLYTALPPPSLPSKQNDTTPSTTETSETKKEEEAQESIVHSTVIAPVQIIKSDKAAETTSSEAPTIPTTNEPTEVPNSTVETTEEAKTEKTEN